MQAAALEATRVRKPRAAKPASESERFLNLLSDIARDPAVSAEKLGQIVSAHERITAQDAQQAFNIAFTAAQQAMSPIVKDAENDATMSRYARLETISQAIDPILHAHGLSTSFGTADSPLERHYRVTCKVRHIGGHAETFHGDVPADLDAYEGEPDKVAVHAYGSSMTYGRRYVKVLAFDIVLKDEDNDGNTIGGEERISQAEVAELTALMDDAGLDRDRLLDFLQLDTLAHIPRRRHAEALGLIAQKKRLAAQVGH